MVAASKLRRAQAAAEAARPYAERMDRVLGNIAAGMAGSAGAPRLLAGTGADQVHLLVVATGERGLAAPSTRRSCGWRASTRSALLAEGKRSRSSPSAARATSSFAASTSGRSSTASSCAACAASASSTPRTSPPRSSTLFDKGEFDVATLFFSRFHSVISQIPTAQQLIPAEAARGRRRVGGVLRIRAGGRRDPRRPAAAQRRGAGVPRAAGERRVVLRRADERDGQRHAQRRRHDPQADHSPTTARARR